MIKRFAVAMTVAMCGFASPAVADNPSDEVIKMNRQAMEAYNRLELGQSQSTLKKALTYARTKKVSGEPLARTYMNLGVVAIGGFSKAEEGQNYFAQALKFDPDITLDPMVATPEMQAVLDKARGKKGGKAGAAGILIPPPPITAPIRASGPPGPAPGQPSAAFESSVLTHVPAEEQLVLTGLPIFVEAPQNNEIAHVELFYRPNGAPRFNRTEMHRIEGGWGDEIPCAEVQVPDMEYYIVAYGKRREVVGYVGSDAFPVTVPIVEQRSTSTQPALPGRTPPQQCTESCPSGTPGCAAPTEAPLMGAGETCHDDNECIAEYVCSDEICVPQSDSDAAKNGPPRWFFQVGMTAGFGLVNGSLRADGNPTKDYPPPQGTDPAVWGQGWVTDRADPNDKCVQENPDKPGYCVNVQGQFFSPTYAVRFNMGYYVSRRIALALNLRYQFSAGLSPGFPLPANMLIGARFLYLITTPKVTGLYVNGHLGIAVGQIQPHPLQAPGAGRPYGLTGLNALQMGSTVGYRFVRNFGLFITPEVNFMFPRTMFDIDATAGVEVAF